MGTVASHPTAKADDSARSVEPLTSAESAEFAKTLGIDPSALLPFRRRSTPTAVPDAALTYEKLTEDPIKSFFAQHPDYYHRIKADFLLDAVRSFFPGQSPRTARVLDVGCGTGELMRALDPHFDTVAGCDPSPAMVRRAGRRAVVMESPTRIPCADEAFDVVVCACVYHHTPTEIRSEHTLEIRRVLRRGGRFLVFEHNPYNLLTRLIVRRCPMDTGARLIEPRTACRVLRTAGFADVRTRYYLFFPETLYRRIGWMEKYLSFTRLGGQFCAIGRNP